MSGTITSALDTPLTLTRFLSHEALTKHEATITLRDLAYNIAKTRKPTKVDLPWLKLASFGDVATDKGSLRNNANMRFVSGVEGDYDQGDVAPEAAAELLRQANIAALIYTSPSHHTVDKDGKYLGERWRVLCPCSASCTTTERYALLSRVNGVLGGILASESFTQSQSYYFGGVGNAKPQTILVEGRPIDLATDLDATAVGKPGGEKLDRIELPKGLEPDETALAALKAACALFDTMEDRQQGRHPTLLAATMAVAPFVLSGHLEQGVCEDAIQVAMESCKGGRAPAFDTEISDAMDGGLKRARAYEPAVSAQDEFPPLEPMLEETDNAALAELMGWTLKAAPAEVPARAVPAKFQWLDIDDIEAMPDPTWLIDGVLPSQGTAVTFGPPKQGKTFTVLSMALHIPIGKRFGRQVDQGAVYYIAGEGAGGLKLRVKAARQHYGIPASVPLHVLTRAAKFTDAGEITALIASIRDKHRASGVPVRLIVIDTLARAMPGSDENAAKDMGLVVEQCDRLRETFQCLVMPVHHTGKDVTRGMRGSTSLDGAVDCAIQVTRQKTETQDVLTVENFYQKEGEEFSPVYFDLMQVGDLGGGRGSLALTLRVAAPAKAKAANPRHDAVLRIVRSMAAEGDGRVSKQEVVERCASDPLVTTAARNNDRCRTVSEYLSALVGTGQLAEDVSHIWFNDPSTLLTELINI